MFLSINPLLPEISFIVIDEDIILEQSTLVKNLDTASTFPRHIIDIMNRHDISEILCITGPGPFTLMRIVTLTCNAIALSRGTKLKGCHFFDIIDSNCIPIIEANPHECIIRQDGIDSMVRREDIEDGTYMGILGTKDFTDGKTFIEYREEVRMIQKIFQNTPYSKNLSPIYFKAPHITGSNKKISPSSGKARAS